MLTVCLKIKLVAFGLNRPGKSAYLARVVVNNAIVAIDFWEEMTIALRRRTYHTVNSIRTLTSMKEIFFQIYFL